MITAPSCKGALGRKIVVSDRRRAARPSQLRSRYKSAIQSRVRSRSMRPSDAAKINSPPHNVVVRISLHRRPAKKRPVAPRPIARAGSPTETPQSTRTPHKAPKWPSSQFNVTSPSPDPAPGKTPPPPLPVPATSAPPAGPPDHHQQFVDDQRHQQNVEHRKRHSQPWRHHLVTSVELQRSNPTF